MTWQIRFHPLVDRVDLPKLPSAVKKEILHAVEKKLLSNPEADGRPLKGPLHGYWKLKIRAYRVIYRIIKNQLLVLIAGIGPRKDDEIYKKMLKRAQGLPQ